MINRNVCAIISAALALAGCRLMGPTVAVMADTPPEKNLPLPGEVFSVAGHTAFIIPAKKILLAK